MAKTKRMQKSKQEKISDELRMRIFALLGIFIIVIAALKLGFIGNGISYAFFYMFGNFTGILYLLLICSCGYIVYTASLPKLSGPRALGIYLIIFSVLMFMSINSDEATGMSIINAYLKNAPLNKGGLVGALIYGLFSTLFAKTGSIIAAIFIAFIGVALLGSKFYLEHKRALKNHSLRHQNKMKDNASKFADFFTGNKQQKDGFFFEDEFDEPESHEVESHEPVEKPKTRIHQSVEEDHDLPTKLEFDEDSLSLDIKDKPNDDFPMPETAQKKTTNHRSSKNYKLPPITLLKNIGNKKTGDNKSHALDSADRLTDVLKEFGVNASISDIFIGPSVTKYELKLETGTRVNKIMQLQDDIKLALAAKDIRIEAPIPGKPAVGVEIPNQSSTVVTFKEVLKDIPEKLQENKLCVPLGKDVSGKCVYAQLNKMPHLLIAGATGSGKSVCINTIICSILMRAKPEEVRLILVDPKKVELSNYNGIPHLLAPVVTDPKKAAATLKEVVAEMERRYDVFAQNNVRNIESYNTYAIQENTSLEDNDQIEVMSYIVVILDEVADLMMVASKDVEDSIMRISQMARAAGIHLIVATQRPSTDVITGVIKANIPSRIAFAVSSTIDSRTILDCSGAEKLLGKGDMLFSPMGASSPTRVQGAFVSDDEVSEITHYVTKQRSEEYDDKYVNVKASSSSSSSSDDDNDEEYEECRAFVIQEQKASTSLLQRRFRIGYNKAARIIDQLEADGIIGPQMGSKPREVYVRGYEEVD